MPAKPLRIGRTDSETGLKIERKVGSGSAGTVYKATARGQPPVSVALKVFKNKEAFKNELEIQHKVASVPGVVHMRGSHGVDGSRPSIEFEFSAVGDITAYWNARGKRPFNVLQTATIMRQLAVAVGELHTRGILHCDLKPSNILCFADSDGRPEFRLCDLGSSRQYVPAHVAQTGRTTSGRDGAGYTLGWAAPEVVRGKRGGIRSDLYSLGVIWYQLLVNELDAESGFPSVSIDRLQTIEYSALVCRVLERCVGFDPASRFKDTRDLILNLETLLGDWFQCVEHAPDPLVVLDPDIRARIEATGLPWRVIHKATGIEMLLVAALEPRGGSVSDQPPRSGLFDRSYKPFDPHEPFYLSRSAVSKQSWSAIFPRRGWGNAIHAVTDFERDLEPFDVFCRKAQLHSPTWQHWSLAFYGPFAGPFGPAKGQPYSPRDQAANLRKVRVVRTPNRRLEILPCRAREIINLDVGSDASMPMARYGMMNPMGFEFEQGVKETTSDGLENVVWEMEDGGMGGVSKRVFRYP